jgi:hypothetical protein
MRAQCYEPARTGTQIAYRNLSDQVLRDDRSMPWWLNIRSYPLEGKSSLPIASVELVRDWLAQCLSEHDSCKVAMDTDVAFYVSTRLIALARVLQEMM